MDTLQKQIEWHCVSQKWENEKRPKPSEAEQIKLKPPSVFQLGFCDPGREEAIQHNCLPTLPGTPLSAPSRIFTCCFTYYEFPLPSAAPLNAFRGYFGGCSSFPGSLILLDFLLLF